MSFFSSLNYSSRHTQTDAILSSARSCHLHSHQTARVQVCWGWGCIGGGGGEGRTGVACINFEHDIRISNKFLLVIT